MLWKLDGVTLRETGKSLHGPAKQPPASNALTIRWHDYYSIYIEISKLNGQSSEIISHKINLC